MSDLERVMKRLQENEILYEIDSDGPGSPVWLRYLDADGEWASERYINETRAPMRDLNGYPVEGS